MEPPWQVSITKNEIFAILCHEGLGLFVTVGRHLKKKKKKTLEVCTTAGK